MSSTEVVTARCPFCGELRYFGLGRPYKIVLTMEPPDALPLFVCQACWDLAVVNYPGNGTRERVT